MEMVMKANFDYVGTERFGMFRKVMEKYLAEAYMELRNLVVDAINLQIEEWNEEFDRIFGEREDYEFDKDYLAFMSEKQDNICEYYDDCVEGQMLVIRSDRETCDLIGVGKLGTKLEGIKVTMTLTLK